MTEISRRLIKLEKVFARVARSEDTWGRMAEFRDELRIAAGLCRIPRHGGITGWQWWVS
jgi:hypothetical protein